MLEIDALPGAHSVTGGEPRMGIVVAQVVLALGLIILGAQIFVGAVEHLSTVIGLDPTILALIIALIRFMLEIRRAEAAGQPPVDARHD